MKQFLCCLALLCLARSTFSQLSNDRGITIGSPVPDLEITGFINSPVAKATIADYKGQLLILDFWATWCAPCITMLPKSDSLNKVFKGRAVILPVTYQSKEEVAKLFRNKASLRNITMPIVTADKVLHEAFPHQELPHYIWIDAKGMVTAITGYKEVTASNINAMLGASLTEPKALPVKTDAYAPYNRDLPLLFNNLNITPEDLQYATVFTGYKPALHSHFDIIRYPDKSFARFTATNMTVFNLLLLAHTYNNSSLPRSRVINVVKDASALEGMNWANSSTEQQQAWMQQHTYCYELIIPKTLSSDFFSMMRQDFTRLFPQYKSGMETRSVECLALVRTSKSDKIKTSGAKPSRVFDLTELTMTNGPVSMVTYRLASSTLQHVKEPVIDDTGYSGNIDISLIGNLSDIESIRTALRKYDLDLVRKKMNIDMLVITDTK